MSERSFEADQTELEAIVERLEGGDIELEELARLWERGEALCRRLSDALSDAQGRIEELSRQFESDRREATT